MINGTSGLAVGIKGKVRVGNAFWVTTLSIMSKFLGGKISVLACLLV